MLFALTGKPFENTLKVPSKSAADVLSETKAAVCSGDSGEIKVCAITGAGERLALDPIESMTVDPRIVRCLFAESAAYVFPEKMLSLLINLSRELSAPPLVLAVEPGANGGLDVSLVDSGLDSIFMPLKLNAAQTEMLSKSAAELKETADREISINNRADKRSLSKRTERLFRSHFGELSSHILESAGRRRLDVHLRASNFSFPFECLSSRLTVRTILAGTKDKSPGKSKDALVVHSPELKHSGTELKTLKSVFGKRFRLNILPDTAAGTFDKTPAILHFTGHGEVRDDRGKILLNGTWTDAIPGGRAAMHVTLNCCHAGWTAAGIVDSLIESGARSVIASPYRLPDSEDCGISEFYRFFHPENPDVSFAIASIVNPNAFFYYKLFLSMK